MNTEEILHKALNDSVIKAIEGLDTELYNRVKDLLSLVVTKYEKVLFGDVGIWVYSDRVEIYNHISIAKARSKHQCKGLLVLWYNSNTNKLGNIKSVQFTRDSYMRLVDVYELSGRVEDIAMGLMDSNGRERNKDVVMGVLGKLSDTYDLVGIRNIKLHKAY
jgi:hypothetical protein